MPGNDLRVAGCLLSAILLLVLSTGLAAQGRKPDKPVSTTGAQKAEPEEEDEAACVRVGVQFGAGAGKSTHGFLSEAADAWMINSLVRQMLDPSAQLAFPAQTPGSVPTVSGRAALRMTWTDRWVFLAAYYRIDQDYGRAGPTSVTFSAPGNTDYFSSAYEGARLLRYQETRRVYDVQYVHPTPVLRLNLGGFLGYTSYSEHNDGSFGSYTSSRSAAVVPNAVTWAQGGAVTTDVRLRSFVFGLAARLRAFDWLILTYRLAPGNRRTGSVNGSGYQTITTTASGTSVTPSIALPFLTGQIIDRGTTQNLEVTIPVFCRYEIHLGATREDYKRSFSSYAGITLPAGNNLAMKTYGIGLGETSSKHVVSRSEAYLRLSIMTDWDND